MTDLHCSTFIDCVLLICIRKSISNVPFSHLNLVPNDQTVVTYKRPSRYFKKLNSPNSIMFISDYRKMYNKRQDIFTGDIELFSSLFSFNQKMECLLP